MIKVYDNGILIFNGKNYHCSFGKNGFTKNKYEGDKMTPMGIFLLGDLYIRRDKINNIKTDFKIINIKKNMVWCDAPTKKKYNTLISSYNNQRESLYRNDNLYDIILVIKYNMNPVIPYKGSAIFIHNINKKYEPTNGCIALKASDLLNILSDLKPSDKINITTAKNIN